MCIFVRFYKKLNLLYFFLQFLSSLVFRAMVTPALPWQCLWPRPTRANPAQPTWWVHTHHRRPTATILHHLMTRSSIPQKRSRSRWSPWHNTLQQISDLSQDDSTWCCPEPLAAYNSVSSSFKWLVLILCACFRIQHFLCSLFNILEVDRAAFIGLYLNKKNLKKEHEDFLDGRTCRTWTASQLKYSEFQSSG